MQRREVLKGALASAAATGLGAPAVAQGIAANRVLRFVPQSNPGSLDPVWTTAYVTRNHGMLVYDTLYGSDAALNVHPQMAAGHVEEDGGRTVIITLREGLKFHDGEKVRAADCIASITRWWRRDPMGQAAAAATDEVSALDDRRIRFRLKAPYPRLIPTLAKPSNACYIMPERVARTDPFQQITDYTGSGPMRFRREEWITGQILVYERNRDYIPAPGGPVSLTAGPKVMHFDRIEWRILPDPATAAAALQAGEIDWWEQPQVDIQPLLRRNRNIVVDVQDPIGLISCIRFNTLHPPFDNPAIRRAVIPAIRQQDVVVAINGNDPAGYTTGVGWFTPGTPMANSAGLEAFRGSIAAGREALRAAGYRGEKVVFLGPTDILAPKAASEVMADVLKQIGFDVDYQAMDWGTVLQRRAKKEPPAQGGWSVLCTSFAGYDFLDPLVHSQIRGNGAQAWFGWPDVPRLEELRNQWLATHDLAGQKRLAAELQRAALEAAPGAPLGHYKQFTAYRRNLEGLLKGIPVFWNVRKT
jgi:peptide/nickel transport system substrate-binding protein